MKLLRTNKTMLLLVGTVILITSSFVYSHCQIPCGIYGDETRFKLMSEHITTIEKSMKQVEALSSKPESNANQIVRWVSNKEKHCEELDEIVTYYFMTQRIKPVVDTESKDYKSYIERLTLLHGILHYNMKARQTTDTANIEKLRELLTKFETAYNN